MIQNNNKFIITIDTEGDNLWNWQRGMNIKTENALFLPRFQSLCDKYDFRPTYLTNYEMSKDKRFIDFALDALSRNACEIGMHLHAWNSPPFFQLKNQRQDRGASYLIEYPIDIMEEKIKILTYEIEDTFGSSIISHRAGRWTTNENYFELLIKYGYKCDCSVTPHKDWSGFCGETLQSAGSNYTKAPEVPYRIYSKDKQKYITEIPVSIKYSRAFILPRIFSLKNIARAFRDVIKGRELWIRPQQGNINHMLYLVKMIASSDADYLMFMLHSSELMPGGSPYYKDELEIERLYEVLEELFSYIHQYFIGSTLKDYCLDSEEKK